jgi:hypothetical protein
VVVVSLVFVMTGVATRHVVPSMLHLCMHGVVMPFLVCGVRVVGHIVMYVLMVFHVWPPVVWRTKSSLRESAHTQRARKEIDANRKSDLDFPGSLSRFGWWRKLC